MIILDVRKYGKKLKLEHCAELYDHVTANMSPMAVNIGYKGRVMILPDELWVTEWQATNIFSNTNIGSRWDYFRGVPIKVKENI